MKLRAASGAPEWAWHESWHDTHTSHTHTDGERLRAQVADGALMPLGSLGALTLEPLLCQCRVRPVSALGVWLDSGSGLWALAESGVGLCWPHAAVAEASASVMIH